jgi:hypothetical protein
MAILRIVDGIWGEGKVEDCDVNILKLSSPNRSQAARADLDWEICHFPVQ